MYHVVCVDDEAFVLEGIEKALDWFGFNMEIAYSTTSPLKALEYIKNHPVELLITDISMPEMNGVDFIRQVKKHDPDLFIIVLSAYDSFDYVRSAMQLGAENYLLKPLDPIELSDTLSLIARHLDIKKMMSINYTPAMLTFRSNFVENWCKSTLNESDFLNRAEMLGVNLSLDNYTVFMFSVNSADADKISRLFNTFLAHMVGKYICHFYFESQSSFFSVLSSVSGSFNMFHFFNILDEMQKKLNFDFFTAAGPTVNNYADVSKSYHTIQKYSCLRFLPLKYIMCQNLMFSANEQRILEQDFSRISHEKYLSDIERLLKSLNSQQRISLMLAVINHGISQLNRQTPDSSMTALLSKSVRVSSDIPDILSYIHTFLDAVSSLLNQNPEASALSGKYVSMIIDSVHDFSNKDISLKTIACQLNMHPSYLGNIFHQQTGFYFNDYLNEERLKYAASLMEDTSIRLKDIADMAGFSSQTYFNRQFKKRFSVSPNAYRRNALIKKNEGLTDI